MKWKGMRINHTIIPQDKSKYRKGYYFQRKGWKPPIGFPFDKKSKQEIKEIKKEHGNGWWVFVGKHLYK
tara:strand:- start:252 stop:458 length:207 start_codon:yes stop_codon:yes gene_type:complete